MVHTWGLGEEGRAGAGDWYYIAPVRGFTHSVTELGAQGKGLSWARERSGIRQEGGASGPGHTGAVLRGDGLCDPWPASHRKCIPGSLEAGQPGEPVPADRQENMK